MPGLWDLTPWEAPCAYSPCWQCLAFLPFTLQRPSRGPGNKNEFLPEAMLYGRPGAVSVLADRAYWLEDKIGLRDVGPVLEKRIAP
jgi:hypothetical protein